MKWKWILLSVVVLGCDDYSECGVTDYSEDIYINFYDIETKAARQVKFQSMEVAFPNEGTIAFRDTVGATGYIFPLDLSANSTNFLFREDDFTYYDLSIGYQAKAFIENPNCGPVFRVTAITAQSAAFDSVVVKVTELSKNVAPHVEIYF